MTGDFYCWVLGNSFNFPWKVKIQDILNYYSKNYLMIFGEQTLKSARENTDYISLLHHLQKGGNAEEKKSSLSEKLTQHKITQNSDHGST